MTSSPALPDFIAIGDQAWRGEVSRTAALGNFCSDPTVDALGWPEDVVEQWLFDLAGHAPFHDDYADLGLNEVEWSVEIVATETLLSVPTGPSEAGCIETYAEDPDWWISVRNSGDHLGVAEAWRAHGTWKRWPLLLDRRLLGPEDGLQLVDGRTRVGILVGRHRRGDHAADSHLAWVGRPA